MPRLPRQAGACHATLSTTVTRRDSCAASTDWGQRPTLHSLWLGTCGHQHYRGRGKQPRGHRQCERARKGRDSFVRLSSRVQRLEQKHATHGRCAVCRDRAPVVLVSVPALLIPDNGRDAIAPSTVADASERTGDATPCPGCGWRPNVMEVHEVIVTNDGNMVDGLSAVE
jgi:hypothetical protein